MKQILLLLLLALPLAACNVSVSTSPEKIVAEPGTAEQRTEVLRVAHAIVAQMDQGQFDTVWDQSSQILKDATFRIVFAKTIGAGRGDLSHATSRAEPRIGFSKTIDSRAPEGEYSIVELDSVHGASHVTERLILAREAGQWKLAGYFVNSKRKFGG